MKYSKFLLMLFISFIVMYSVMFLNVTSVDHIYLSTNRFYMSILMVAPMGAVMMLLMGKMYPNKKLNLSIIAASILVFSITFYFLRNQTAIGDRAYMKAMIPHHSSAILTSKKAEITDPEVKKLSLEIIKAQEEEIAQMKRMLERLEKE